MTPSLLVALTALSSLPVLAEPVAEGEVTGLVFDQATGLPVEGVQVAGGGQTATTDRFGAFVLSLPPGAVTLTLSGPGGLAGAVPDVGVAAGQVSEVLISLSSEAPARVSTESAKEQEPQVEEDAALATLSGTIQNEEGAAIAGARIYVRGWTGEGRSGADGAFSFQVPVGTHELSVLSTGYAAGTVPGVEVTAEGGTVVVQLVEVGMALAEFKVTVPRVSGGESTLLAERQDASEVVDSLSAEQMTRRGDSSAAAALQRVTGLTVVDGKFVYVRGLGERYSASLFNGSTLPSPEPGRRVVPLDLFPTAMLESVVIQKTYSASMPGEFGGGVVRLRTKGVPEEPVFKVSLNSTYQDGTTFQEGWAIDRGPQDWLGYGTEFRALPASVEQATRNTPLQLLNALPGSVGFTNDELETLGKAFKNRWGLDRVEARPDVSASVVAGGGVELPARSKLGIIAGGTYRNQWDRALYDSTTYVLDGDELTPDKAYSFDELSNTVALSGILHVAGELLEHQKVGATLVYIHDAESYALEGYGEEDDIGTETRRQREQWTERTLKVTQVEGDHTFPFLMDLGLDWRYALSQASRAEPDRRDLLMQPVDETRTGPNDDWYLRFQGGGHSMFYSALDDVVGDLGLDAELPWGNHSEDARAWHGSVGVGLQNVNRVRGVDVRRFRYDILGTGEEDGGRGFLVNEPQDIFVPDNINEDGLRVAEGTLATDNYEAVQEIRGRYVETQVAAPWGTSLLLGMRLESSFQRANTFQLFSADAEPVTGLLDTVDRLPAATLTQPLSGPLAQRPMQLRLGYGKTVNRPDLRELSPSTYYDVKTNREVVGNPDLTRAVIENYDVRWEWYLSSDESVSVAGFVKQFTDPIESVIEVGAAGRLTLANASAAQNNGLELDVRKSIGSGSGTVLDDLYVMANASFIQSSVELGEIGGSATSKQRPLQGQSPWVYNAQLSYEGADSPVRAAVLYNVSGPRITQVGTNGVPDQYQQPVHRLDTVVNVDLGAGWSSRLSGRNLLDSPSVETVGNQTSLSIRRGWQVGLGVSWQAPGKDERAEAKARRGARRDARSAAPAG